MKFLANIISIITILTINTNKKGKAIPVGGHGGP
jgi:hypothetical protein